jgi:hypothetical protein
VVQFDFDTGCWEWTGTRAYGYGRIKIGGKSHLAHRVVYEQMRGGIPQGLDMDHVCRNKGCVNPAHLQPVTHRENVMRGISFAATYARATHCIRGHAFDEKNTQIRVTPDGTKRRCRACHQIYGKRRRAALASHGVQP